MIFIDGAILLQVMQEDPLKLSQIVTAEEIKDQHLSLMHKLGNSLRRSSSQNEPSPVQHSSYYQCRLPEVGFRRKDLSLILRYLFYKEEMQLADRNLLRRIMITTFDEETICAGGKKFIHFLRLFEDKDKLEPTQIPFLYFLLKGKGEVRSSHFSYQVKAGDIFGQIQLMKGTSIQSITFESSFLLLTLGEKEFNLFFHEYYLKKYTQRLIHLEPIEEIYLRYISETAKYYLLKSIDFKQCSQREKIVNLGEKIEFIYFVSARQKQQQLKSSLPCLGLMEILKGSSTYQETFICIRSKRSVPFVKVTDFKAYVLDVLDKESYGKQVNQDLAKNFLSLNPVETPKERPKLISFMRRKRVNISLTKSRLKTEPGEYFSTHFKFLKPEIANASFRYRKYTQKRIGNSLQRESNNSFLSKKQL